MISKFSVFIIVIIAVTGLDAACPNNPTEVPVYFESNISYFVVI
jgi:hypothetical protein